jgi:IS5 family transposase
MRSSKKGNQWHFGMKAHIGVDASSGLVHTAGVTSGSVHDATVMDRLIRADDTAVYGDKGYASGARRRAAEAAGVLWAVKEKAQTGRRLTVRQRASNRRFGKVCAKVEHVFRVLKCQFGYRKVRYRGLAKNAAQVFSLLALANLYLARRTLASA